MLVLIPTTWISQIVPSHQYSLKVMVNLMMSIGLIKVLCLRGTGVEENADVVPDKCATNKLLLLEPATENKNYKNSEGTRRIH